MSDIAILLEAQPYITSRWLACHLDNVNYDEASKLLENANGIKTHIVSGFRKSDSTLVFSLSKKPESIDTLQSKSFHVYSVQKFVSESDPTQLEARGTEQVLSLLQLNPVDEKLILNSIGGIKLPDLKVLPIGKRLQTNVQSVNHNTSDTLTTGAAVKAAASSMFPPKSTPSSTTTKASKPPAAVSNFFGKSSGSASSSESQVTQKKSLDSTANETVLSSTPDDEQKTVSKRPKAKNALEADDEEQWDDGTGVVPDKSVIREREHSELARVNKRFIVEEDEEVEADTNSNSSDSKKKKRGRGKKIIDITESEVDDGANSGGSKKPVSLLRGAMDDYFEDVAIAAEIEKQQAEASGVPMAEVAKKKRRKLVEKVLIMSIMWVLIYLELCPYS